MIVYIHGFGGSGEGSKARAFRHYFGEQQILFAAPSLSYVPELAIKTLEEIISVCQPKGLIGSSLGGYYTLYLSQKYRIKSVLLNPSIHPAQTLNRALGEAPNFYDESHFEWKQPHLEMLEGYHTEIDDPGLHMLLVQKGDALLDATEAIVQLKGAWQIVEEGGSHAFEGIERHFDEIRDFLL